ncbi:Holin of 3TMs, for gene-transfer release [uncultured Caudovirales phage]|uniref:Holin of 3TMs, for gene-transfer release n=1 Tax=uncultured Caudovirales phage TaxID=2100421 RepID=A0A6J5NHR4_9CAUD|nr:Holin of 3TMs, for gene-transfer release [uncultured Caudovirales phage]
MPKLEEYNNDGYQNSVSAAAAQKLAASPSLTQTEVKIDTAAQLASTNSAAAQTASAGAQSLIKNTNEDWINKKWRPAMSWSYMAICIFDFILAPVLWSAIQAYGSGSVSMQWQPLTLQGAGLLHVAFGAVLGVTAWGRTQEKLDSKN